MLAPPCLALPCPGIWLVITFRFGCGQWARRQRHGTSQHCPILREQLLAFCTLTALRRQRCKCDAMSCSRDVGMGVWYFICSLVCLSFIASVMYHMPACWWKFVLLEGRSLQSFNRSSYWSCVCMCVALPCDSHVICRAVFVVFPILNASHLASVRRWRGYGSRGLSQEPPKERKKEMKKERKKEKERRLCVIVCKWPTLWVCICVYVFSISPVLEAYFSTRMLYASTLFFSASLPAFFVYFAGPLGIEFFASERPLLVNIDHSVSGWPIRQRQVAAWKVRWHNWYSATGSGPV